MVTPWFRQILGHDLLGIICKDTIIHAFRAFSYKKTDQVNNKEVFCLV